MSTKRMMVIHDSSYLYRANPESLTGKQWKPSPKTLYEKCFVDSRLIYDVAMTVPKQYMHVRDSYFNAARYTLSQYEHYLSLMASDERKEFRNICRKAFFENGFVRDLLPKKRYARYQLWLWGVKSLPK